MELHMELCMELLMQLHVHMFSASDRQRAWRSASRPRAAPWRSLQEIEEPTVATAVHLFPTADFQEREVYDMFGVVFDGHPDMRRILMPEDWDGHPLRKDYEVGRIPVQFKGANA